MTDYPHGHLLRYTGGCHCDLCKKAKTNYEALRLLDIAHGKPRSVNPIGTRRRIQALACRGWTKRALAERLGVTPRSIYQWMHEHDLIWRSTAEKVTALYDEICMLEPTATTVGEARGISSAKTYAKRQGWAPPLAWDDDTIDDPDAKPYRPTTTDQTLVDDVLVQRILDGDRDLARQANKAEKCEVARRWLAAGRSLSSLEWTGWRVERYKPRATPGGRWVQVGNRRVWEVTA